MCFSPLNAELNPICHLLALLGARHILHISGVRVKAIMDYLKDFENWSIYVNLLATKSGKRERVSLTSGPLNSTITKKSTTFPL